MSKIIYKHRLTGESIQVWKVTPSLWYRLENGERIYMKQRDLKQYKFQKKESDTGGWKADNRKFFKPQL
jgi:hypothetical protein